MENALKTNTAEREIISVNEDIEGFEVFVPMTL